MVFMAFELEKIKRPKSVDIFLINARNNFRFKAINIKIIFLSAKGQLTDLNC